MPTSGVTLWTTTAGDLIISAMIELGAMSMGDEPEDSEMDEAVKRLNAMLQSWATEGNLYRDGTGTLTITGGTGAATLPQEIREIRSLAHVLSPTNYRTLYPWNRDQYLSLPNRATVGNPSVYYHQQGAEADTLKIWPVPVTDISLAVDYGRAAYVVTNPDETVDIPQDWFKAALFSLAADMAGMFGAVKLDPMNVQRVTAIGQSEYQRLLDKDRPDSYIFERDDYCGARC